MSLNSWLLLLAFAGSAPWLGQLWRANRATSLAHAVAWATAAWLAWVLTIFVEPVGGAPGAALYLALALTGCSAIAVLGARRPGVRAWDAVVAALLAVELLPLGESFLRGGPVALDGLRLATLGGTLAIGVMNYLPTGSVLVAIALGVGCCCEWIRFAFPDDPRSAWHDGMGRWLVALALWGWSCQASAP